MNNAFFHRTHLLFGDEKMNLLKNKRVIIFGIGGVGSWCAESLIRTGIQNLTIVDSDRVCATNINRQLMATAQTVGHIKVDALKNRLLEINPSTNINALQKRYNEDTYQEFKLEEYDYIIDAIDSTESKLHLMRTASRAKGVFFSSMGAALRIDPSRIKVSPFWDIQGCHFARKIRKDMRKGELPAKNFLCVYSDEILKNLGSESERDSNKCNCPKSENGPNNQDLADHDWCSLEFTSKGSLAHMTAIYGFRLAGLVIEDIYQSAVPEALCSSIENQKKPEEHN